MGGMSGSVSGGGVVVGEKSEVKLLGYVYGYDAALQLYWYGNSTYTELTFCGHTLKTIPP